MMKTTTSYQEAVQVGAVLVRQVAAQEFQYWLAGDADIPPNPPEYPSSIVLTPRQFLQALTKAGLRTVVESAVAAGNQDLKDWYNRATEFESTHPVLLTMARSLGKTNVDIDALFAMGATL